MLSYLLLLRTSGQKRKQLHSKETHCVQLMDQACVSDKLCVNNDMSSSTFTMNEMTDHYCLILTSATAKYVVLKGAVHPKMKIR